MLTYLENTLEYISNAVWGPLLFMLMGTHIFLTIKLKGIQKYTFKAIKLSFANDNKGEGEVTQFGSLATTMAATVGTGNIVGVATAVSCGGPGAIFWLWLSGILGMATKYAETTLAVKYRRKNRLGQLVGGPMYVLEYALNKKWLGMFFAFFTVIACFGTGATVQSNSIAQLIKSTFGIPTWYTGILIATLTGIVILRGIKGIAKVCEILVPAMAVIYILGCTAILFKNVSKIPSSIILILKSAFTGHAAAGGFIGATITKTMRYGIARGLFSNESGLGSAPIASAAAQTRNAPEHGLIQMTGNFWSTAVVCLLTGLVLVVTDSWTTGLTGAELTKNAFEQIFLGPVTLTVGLLAFAYSTILGWAYYCEKAAEYLLGEKVVVITRWLWVIAVFLGAVLSLPIVWYFSDIFNALMAVPNLISLIALSNILEYETKKNIVVFKNKFKGSTNI